jgi:hypothetical protein
MEADGDAGGFAAFLEGRWEVSTRCADGAHRECPFGTLSITLTAGG